MNLSTRNHLFVFLGIIPLLFLLAIAIFFGLSYFNHEIFSFEEGIRYLFDYDAFFIFEYNQWAVVGSVVAILAYVSFCSFFVIKYFEKTYVPEIFYFCAFLFCCLPEGLRIFVPVLQTYVNDNLLLMISTRLIFFSRLMVALLMLAAGLSSDKNSEFQSESNYYILIAFSIIITCIIPINTLEYATTNIMPYSFYRIFIFIRVLFAILTATSFFVAGLKTEINEYKKSSIYFLILISGLFLLQESDCIFFAAMGTTFLFIGTVLFLKTLRQCYS